MKQFYPHISCNKFLGPCEFCHMAKQKCLPFPCSHTKSIKVFDLIHVDIWGPLSIPSTSGHKYFLTIVDDHTRFTWLYFLKHKSEASIHLQNFVALIETQFDKRVKSIRSDNGLEFQMSQFYAFKGILYQTSCVESPQQNGIVERKHQHILGVARALLFHSNLPCCFWNYAIAHATYLINRLPTPFLNNNNPYFQLFNSLPDLHDLKVFGCLVFASTVTAHRKKLDSRARKCTFLGYQHRTKGFLLYDMHTKEIFISHNVHFYEFVFPFWHQLSDCSQNTSHSFKLSQLMMIVDGCENTDHPNALAPNTHSQLSTPSPTHSPNPHTHTHQNLSRFHHHSHNLKHRS